MAMKQKIMNIITIYDHLLKSESICFVPLGIDYKSGWGLPAHKHDILSERIANVSIADIGDKITAEVKRGMSQDDDGLISGGEWLTKTGVVVSAQGDHYGFVQFSDGDRQLLSLIIGDTRGYPGKNVQVI